MKTFESKSECSPVESFLWSRIAFNYGSEFAGVKELSVEDLENLKRLVELQLAVEKFCESK